MTSLAFDAAGLAHAATSAAVSAGGTRGGLYYSADDGATWSVQNKGLADCVRVQAIVADPRDAGVQYAVGRSGFFSRGGAPSDRDAASSR